MASPRDYLILRLWGPMASWGGIAVGEQRQTWTRPSRSGVLGIVAAALGYQRADQAAHASLEHGIGLAIRVDNPGRPMRDYHTAQSPSSERNRRWTSRYDEVRNSAKLNTILSDRDYLTEASAVVALWLRPGCHVPPLPVLAQKLRTPSFALYLGRKASPMGLPMLPRLGAAKSLFEALSQFDTQERETAAVVEKAAGFFPKLLRDPAARPLVWLSRDDVEEPDQSHSGIGSFEIEEYTQRRDSIRDRRTWTFNDRAEVRVLLTGEKTL